MDCLTLQNQQCRKCKVRNGETMDNRYGGKRNSNPVACLPAGRDSVRLEKFQKFFYRKVGIVEDLFKQSFADVYSSVNRDSYSLVCSLIDQSEMSSFLPVFFKASALQSTDQFFRFDYRKFRVHLGMPMQISSTWTIFSAWGIFLERLESDSK